MDLVQREVPRERRVPHGRADERRNHQEAFTIVPNITKTCSILLSLRKGTTREKMIRKEGDTQVQAGDPVARLQKGQQNILLCKAHHFHLRQQGKLIPDLPPDQPLLLIDGQQALRTRRFLATTLVPEDPAVRTVQDASAVLYYLLRDHSALMMDRQHIPPPEPEVRQGELEVLTGGVPMVHSRGHTVQGVQEDVEAEVRRVADRHLGLLIIGAL